MIELVTWVGKIEKQTKEIYDQAVQIFAADNSIRDFLVHIRDDENWHYQLMVRAGECLASGFDGITAISIDQATHKKIDRILNDFRDGLTKGTLSRADLLLKIAELEFSEWNAIFLYTLKVLKELFPEFKYPAAKIQAHLKEIALFLESEKIHLGLVQELTALPPLWTENILIVEDNKTIADLFSELLKKEGTIDVAYNGQEGLEQIEKKFYKLVISDLDMPIMDGISFYRAVIEKYPSLTNRFLFVSGVISDDRLTFFFERNLKFLKKPVPINLLREESLKIMISR